MSKLSLFLFGLAFGCGIVQASSQCINRSVRVVAPQRNFKKIEFYFALVSSLPFQVSQVAAPDKVGLVAIDIGYHWPAEEDDFSTPSSMELADRVYKMLKPKVKEWGIVRMEAFFDPKVKC